MRRLKPAVQTLLVALVSAALAAAVPSYKVRYRTATNVYLDAGRAQGLAVGDRLRVMDGQAAVAELEVVYVAEQSASCKVVSETRPVRVGEVVVPVAAPRAAAPAPDSAATPAPAPAPAATSPTAAYVPPATAAPAAAPWARLRGFASVGYYHVWDQTDTALDFSQFTTRLDLRLDDIGGQPFSVVARLSGRQTSRAFELSPQTPQSERTDRLYELALRYAPASDRIGFEVGRVGIYRFVGIGYLDGGIFRFRLLDHLQLGAFGGRVAEIETLNFGGVGSKYGGFVRLLPAGRYGTGGYDVMLAYVRENANGDTSREYLSLESRFGSGRRFWLFERAELDLNHGWRQELTGKSYQFSNVSLSANLQLSTSVTAFAAYDGRRNYRYYQNRDVPSEVFDNLLHQGIRGGLNYTKAGGFGATAGFGMNLKEQDPLHPDLNLANAWFANAGVRHANLFAGFAARVDGTGFSNGYTQGGLVTAALGRRLHGGHSLDLSYGYSFYDIKPAEISPLTATTAHRATQWLRLLGRADLGHRLYLQADAEYGSGDDLKGPRGFLELGYQF